MKNEKRIELEQDIVRRYLAAVAAAGWHVVEMTIDGERSSYPDELFAGDDATVIVERADGKRSVLKFIYGNRPGEVLNDYGLSLETAIAEVEAYAEQWA
jgi:hypothetical protein